MKNKHTNLLLGLVFALLACFSLGYHSANTQYSKLVEECEAQLPRHLNCELTATPKQEDYHD